MKFILGVHRNYWILILSFFLAIVLHFKYPQFYLLYIYIGLIFLSATFLNYKFLFLLLLFYAVVAPNAPHRYPIIPIYFHVGAGFLLFLLVLGYFIIDKVFTKQTRIISDKFDYIILVFTSWAFVAFFVGIMRRYALRDAILDLAPLLFFLAYYISFNSKRKFQEKILKVIIIGIFICGIEYMLIAGAGFATQLGAVTRIITRQANLSLFLIPLFVTRYFFTKTNKERIRLMMLLIPIFAMLLLSQQRSLWVSVFISLVITFYLCTKFLGSKRVFAGFPLIIIFLIVAFAASAVITGAQFFSDILSLRFSSILAPMYDLAFLERLVNVKEVMNEIGLLSSIVPNGLGETHFQPWMSNPMPFVDNSYVTAVWKMGWLGLILLLLIWFLPISRSIKLAEISPKDRIFAISFFACFVSILIHSLTVSMIVRYHYNLLWASLIGILNQRYVEARDSAISVK